MTKGEAYRTYYLANRERILQANKERRKEKAQNATTEEKQKQRISQRNKKNKIRSSHNKATFEELAKITTGDGEWSQFYRILSTAHNLHLFTPQMVGLLATAHLGELHRLGELIASTQTIL